MTQNRYAWHYRLLNVAMLAQIIVLADSISEKVIGTGSTSDYLSRESYAVVLTTISCLAFLLPALLIFQRWMRDEFAERLWQETAGTVLKSMIILPLPLSFLVGFFIETSSPSIAIHPRPGTSHDAAVALDTFLSALIYTWILTPVFFTWAFEWHRWRASR